MIISVEAVMKSLLLLLLFASVSDAQFWKKKDYPEWSREECIRLGKPDNSPWVRSNYTDGRFPHMPAGFHVSEHTYVVFIASAWTIQRSDFCATQMPPNYDQLPRADRVSIENRFVKQPFPDTIVVRVWYTSRHKNLAEYWLSRTREQLAQDIALVVDGTPVSPLDVQNESLVNQGHGFWFGGWLHVKFPRQLRGSPILSRSTRRVRVEITGAHGKVEIPFKVRRMMVRGELVY